MNLAALAALARGDIDNAVVAATPGGIEAQEAAGQVTFCTSSTLPKDCPRAELEAAGVKFGDDQDDLFVKVTLPAGWKKQATDHSMWSDLIDGKGRKRAGIFYKAAFYDRSAHAYIVTRYSFNAYRDGSDKDHYAVVIEDGGKVIHTVGEYQRRDWNASKALEKQAQAWLDEKFPEWESKAAYWD